MLNESDDLDILEVTFYSTMTFEMHIRSVSRACSFSMAWDLEKVLARFS